MAAKKKAVSKTTVAKKPDDGPKAEVRKVAPQIVVSRPANRNSYDQIIRDNPNKEFVNAPAGSPSGSLSEAGLIPVKGPNGQVVRVGNRMICESVSTKRLDEVAKQNADATERIAVVKDNKQGSGDKTSKAKAPPS